MAGAADPLLLVAAGLLGLVVGSFLNVVIHRLPIMLERDWRAECAELLADTDTAGRAQSAAAQPAPPPFNLMVPRSRCPHCEHPIGVLGNIPLLSYVLLRGRCRHCAGRISPRYPLVEVGCAVLSVVVVAHFGATLAALAALALCWALIALALIDADTTLLPDDITLPWLWLGLAFNLHGGFVALHDAVLGAMAGYLVLRLVYEVFKLLTGKEGMGFGDFKLLAMLGAWLGWQQLPVIILLSSVVGAVVGIALIVLRGHQRQVPIPFGPYLAAAGVLALLWGPQLTQLYLGALW